MIQQQTLESRLGTLRALGLDPEKPPGGIWKVEQSDESGWREIIAGWPKRWMAQCHADYMMLHRQSTDDFYREVIKA